MAQESYEAAERAIDRAVGEYRRILSAHRVGALADPAVAADFAGPNLQLLAALHDAFTSAPDPRDQPQALIDRAIGEVKQLEEQIRYSEHPPEGAADLLGRLADIIATHARRADEIVRLTAIVSVWEERRPALAAKPVRNAATDILEQVHAMPILGGFPARTLRAGMGAFGPRWAVDVANHYLDVRYSDRRFWALVLLAMDELAAWAAATRLGGTHGIPAEFQSRAIHTLLAIAGHPELTAYAVPRIPLHRLTRVDRRELAELLADRNDVMPVDWLAEPDQLATLAVEVVYLQALDAAETSWPGDPALQ